MEKKPIFIKNIQEAEEILGLSLNAIKKLGKDYFFSYYGKRASAVVLVAPRKIYKRRIIQKPFPWHMEWLDKAGGAEDAFSIIHNAMQVICGHLGWERRV